MYIIFSTLNKSKYYIVKIFIRPTIQDYTIFSNNSCILKNFKKFVKVNLTTVGLYKINILRTV